MADTGTQGRRKGRSPSYPAIDLETAIERARTLYEREHKHATQPGTVAGHWGYSAKSSTALVALAALKKFGLLVDQGSGKNRRVKLSELALRILLAPEGSTERVAAIREAALIPGIHTEIWSSYEGSLPSDDTLRYNLVMERDFTETGAREFIGQLRRTLAYAGFLDSDTLSDAEGDKNSLGEDSEDGMSSAADPVTKGDGGDPGTKDFQFTVTLYGGRLATVKAPIPMSKKNLERLQRMIADQLEPFVDADGA